MNSIFSQIKRNYLNSNKVTRLIYINIVIFLLYKILVVSEFLGSVSGKNEEETQILSFIKEYLFLPADIKLLLLKPWTLITYMFIHIDFLHILFNLAWLYFGSKLFLTFLNNKQLYTTYILGCIFGCIFFITSYNLFPVFQDSISEATAIGASAGVLAIFIAVSTYKPNKNIQIPIIGNIKLKYIAISLVILDILSVGPENPGGHIAHLGGAFFGYLYILLLKNKWDLSINFHKFTNIFSKRSKRPTKKRQNKYNDDIYRKNRANTQKEIDLILEKISKSGYDSLTKKEKELLFNESKK